jgi:hypothetical protein
MVEWGGFHDHGIYDPFRPRHNGAGGTCGAVGVPVVVVVLALVGGAVILSWVLRARSSTARVFKAANRFQTTSVAAISAIGAIPLDEIRQIRALKAWEDARQMIRSLEVDEQRIVAATLRDRGFRTAEVAEALSEFIESRGPQYQALDQQVAALLGPRAVPLHSRL